jgi:hypothetical protein
MTSFYLVMFLVPLLIIGLAVVLSLRVKFRDNG